MTGLCGCAVESDRFKVVVPQVNVHTILRRSVCSPQLARGEAYRIHMLGFLPEKMSICIGKNKNTVIAVDDAQFAAHVARLTSMARRIDIARAHTLPRSEGRGYGHVTARWHAFRNQLSRLVSAECR